MKKIITSAVIIAACTALCALVWPQTDAGKEVPAEVAVSAMPAVGAESTPASETAYAVPDAKPMILAEKEKQFEDDTSAITPDAAPAPDLAPKPAIPATTAVDSSDPYHTDIYPNNVYSEKYLYDAEGNLIGKTTTFGPDAIWINGRAYYDIPGFGLVEWSGPGQCTEAYNMYESGVKVGIMGDEDEAPARTAAAAQPETCPEPTGRQARFLILYRRINSSQNHPATRTKPCPETGLERSASGHFLCLFLFILSNRFRIRLCGGSVHRLWG